MLVRTIEKIDSPKVEPGFLGAGHTARRIVGGDFSYTDPFIFLMDDMLDKQDTEPAGGPHPHAGFETVSLMIDGELKEMLESMKKGDFQVMTAGSGTVHTEPLVGPIKGRLFQMWLNLPKKDRWVLPRLQILSADRVPVLSKPGMNMRLYSGSLAGLYSPVRNYTPLIAAEFKLEAGVENTVQIPADFKAFLFVIDGGVFIGDKKVEAEQVAWLNTFQSGELSDLTIQAGETGARLVLYAAKPTGDEIVSYGPFIADTEAEISSLYKKYRSGGMQHISTASDEQKLVL